MDGCGLGIPFTSADAELLTPAIAIEPLPVHPEPAVINPLILWLLGDGKPGHENQSLGLADALARRIPCQIHRISIAGNRGPLSRMKAAMQGASGLPMPDLILAAGHATHPALLWLARKNRAMSVVLMRPSLPLNWFDLCIAPAHDFPSPPRRENVIVTQGALNRVAPPTKGERGGRVILIGGPSSSHGWDGDTLLDNLAEITASGAWQLTDSRRTPYGFTDEIKKRLPTIGLFHHQQTSPDWLPANLAAASEVWVTEDSVSMIYEALSSGARVGLLPVPRQQGVSRVQRGVEYLIENHFLTTFADWQKTQQVKAPPAVLAEAERCAEVIIRRLKR